MQNVNASIITIGDELLIGQTIDTNSAFIAQELNKTCIRCGKRQHLKSPTEYLFHDCTFIQN